MIASPRHYTPKEMARFTKVRLRRIEIALLEIAGCYGEIDRTIEAECDDWRDRLQLITELAKETEEAGKTL